MKSPTRAGPSVHFRSQRDSYAWLNAHRCATTADMKRLCADTATLIENYETSPVADPKLRRMRRRRKSSATPDATKFRVLVEGLMCDLARLTETRR